MVRRSLLLRQLAVVTALNTFVVTTVIAQSGGGVGGGGAAAGGVIGVDGSGLAQQAGLKTGDQVLSMNGTAGSSQAEIQAAMLQGMQSNKPMSFTVQRNGQVETLTMGGDGVPAYGPTSAPAAGLTPAPASVPTASPSVSPATGTRGGI